MNLPEFVSQSPPHAGFIWNRADCAASPLNLSVTLASGQNFRWRQDAARIWWGVVGETVVAVWQVEGQPDSPLYWQTFPQQNQWAAVADYFRLDVDLEALYADWARAEPRIEGALRAFRGLRILRQPPEECLFAFQCAACNTVVKIERSVAHLATHYGPPIATGLASRPFFHVFPGVAALAHADESVLRAGLWGYRAPRVIALARHLQTLSPDWLFALRRTSYPEAHAALASLFGIGAKLADCICLFSLDKDAAVPVDTHIRQIAVSLFAPEMAGKSLTPRVYTVLADAYRSRFGPYAGWAQQYLFFDRLRRAGAYRE
jgi:N-glycosylase/DNA lyase